MNVGDEVRPPPVATKPPGFLARLGLAIVHPRWALSVAADRRYAGRSGSDLILVIMIVMVATRLRGLFAAVWLGRAIEIGLGLRAAMHVLTRALTVDLGFLVIGAFVLWACAGRKRDLGRAFDLACVAALPLLYVDLVATVIARGFELDVPAPIGWLLAGSSYGWAGVVLALGSRSARISAAAIPNPPADLVRASRRAGLGVVAVALIGAIVQAVWIAHSMEDLRPLRGGEPVPALVLPTVGAHGVLGAPYSIAQAAGSVVVIDFFATWCGPCLKSMPALDALARTHPGVVVLAIDLDDPVAARALFDEHGYTLRLLEDDSKVSERFGVMSIPHTVVVDRAGSVSSVDRGTADELAHEVESLLRAPK